MAPGDTPSAAISARDLAGEPSRTELSLQLMPCVPGGMVPPRAPSAAQGCLQLAPTRLASQLQLPAVMLPSGMLRAARLPGPDSLPGASVAAPPLMFVAVHPTVLQHQRMDFEPPPAPAAVAGAAARAGTPAPRPASQKRAEHPVLTPTPLFGAAATAGDSCCGGSDIDFRGMLADPAVRDIVLSIFS